MDENHQQQQQQPKFNHVEDCCTAQIFTLNQQDATHHHHYYSHQQPPPASYIFSQLQPNLPGPPQGFLQYQNNRFQSLPLQPQSRPQENVSCGVSTNITPSVPCFPLTFKADLDENIGKNGGMGGGGGGGGGGEDGLLRGSEQQLLHYVPDTRRAAHYGWQNQEDSAIRQPFWKSFCTDLTDNGSNIGGNGIKDKEVLQQPEMNQSKYYRNGGEEGEQQMNTSRNGRIYGELEDICRIRNDTSVSVVKGTIADRDDGSVEDFATITSTTASACLPPPANAAAAAAETTAGGGGGDEAPPRMDEEMMRERRETRDHEMSSMAVFFEGLVHQLMEYQENLHRKFIAAIEKLDQERKAREEVWRQKELERLEQEAALRANERALASQREASIVSYLEKITGQSIQLPPKNPNLELQQGISSGLINELSSSHKVRGDLSLRLMNKRWPKAEVDALIQIRSSLEKRFQGPGYKGPLWDEISRLMASMGFQRTPKRCKEKWENINKYFKKSRENSNSKQSRKKVKTCQYFDQLDQLYSKSSGVVINNGPNSCSSSSEHQANPNSGNILLKQNAMDFNGSVNGNLEELKQGSIIKSIDGEHLMEDAEEGEVGEGDGNDLCD